MTTEQVPSNTLLDRLRRAEAEHCRQRSLESSLLGEAANEIQSLEHRLSVAYNLKHELNEELNTLRRANRASNEPPAGCAQCSNVAPIAKLTVRDGRAVRAGLYAPGLPDGEHDVYPVASSQPPAPALRPDGMPEPSLDVLKRVATRMRTDAPDSAYLVDWAAEQIEELLAIARASRNVCAYDWSDNDEDAVATMDRLHAVIGPWLARSTPTKPAEPCEKCGGSGRLMIYDKSLYMGQLCSPIGDEPCPACSSEGERDE